MTWESIWTIIVLKGSIHKKNTVKKSHKRFKKKAKQQSKTVNTVKKTVQTGQIGQNGQWRSNAVNTVKNGEKPSKMVFKKWREKMVNKVKKRSKTVNNSQNWSIWIPCFVPPANPTPGVGLSESSVHSAQVHTLTVNLRSVVERYIILRVFS